MTYQRKRDFVADFSKVIISFFDTGLSGSEMSADETQGAVVENETYSDSALVTGSTSQTCLYTVHRDIPET